MFESLFEFLFKYRPLVFEEGERAFRPTSVTYLVAVAVVVAGVVTLRTYQGVRANSRPFDRAVLTVIRFTILALLLLCLFRPVLVLSRVVPQQNFLGVLIDASRSMQIADRDGQTRADFVTQQFGSAESPLLAALADRFELRLFSFSSTTDRIEAVSDLAYNGTQTHLGQALTRTHEELAGVPLSGLVVVSDGADNADDPLGDALLPLQAAGVPVFTVGLGREEYSRDIQLSRVETPRSVLKGAALVVDVVVAQTGYRGQTVTLQVEDEGRIVADQEVILPDDGEPTTVRVRFTASDAGPRLFSFRIAPEPDEMVTQNNLRHALIVVADTREKILYFEGEPRWEVKFLRRAVADDEKPPARRAAADRREQVHAPRRKCRGGGAPAWRVPPHTRGAVPISGPHPGEHRGESLHARPAADDCRFRQRTWRRSHHAWQSSLLCRGRLRRDPGGRRAAGGARRGRRGW